jgi:meiotic recombination protein DMC1
VDKLLEACKKALSNPSELGGFVTAATFREMRKDVVRITTGSKAVDEVLAGGIQTRSITEIHGEWRCGKTQLCHTLAVSTQLPFEMGGGYAKVAYIDTEGTFRSERILEIAERYGMDGEAVLENIMIARTFTHEQMEDALLAIAGKMAEEPFKLLIVDSVMAHYRVDFTGRGELSGRQQRLGQFMSKLSKLADEFNLAIVCTNQVQSDPGAMAFAGVEPKKPIGGHVLAHASTIRLCVRKGRAEARVLKVMQGPDLKEQDAEFMISNGGVVDIE